MKITKEELKSFVYEAMKEILTEQSRGTAPDQTGSESKMRVDEEGEGDPEPVVELVDSQEKELTSEDVEPTETQVAEEKEELKETTDEVVAEDTEEVTTEEVETEDLKEWHNNSLYGKLLKEYTKR